MLLTTKLQLYILELADMLYVATFVCKAWRNLPVEDEREHMCFYAVEAGHFELLKWACGMGWPCDRSIVRLAAEEDNREILSWLIEKGYPHKGASMEAASSGNLDLLIWLHERGCDMNGACFWADTCGETHVLEWLKAEGQCSCDGRYHMDFNEWKILCNKRKRAERSSGAGARERSYFGLIYIRPL